MEFSKEELRSLILGVDFKPKVEDIPTPQIFVDKGWPADGLLRYVGMSANEADAINKITGENAMLNTALFICHTLRWRDGDNAHVLPVTDAQALTEQDIDLLSALGQPVKEFLGLVSKADAVEDAKNDSGATTQNDGGGESPTSQDTEPQQTQSDDSTTTTS